MKTRILHLIFGLAFLLIATFHADAQTDWRTPAEKTDYRTTPRLRETVEYLKRLEKTSKLIKVTSFGLSGENRELPLVIAAKDDAFTPEIARKQNKIIILIQADIHAGESDGKDAGLALLRDIAITKTRQNLLDNVVILFEPIYNADGHERFGAFNRINQNGPEEMGFRANATNLNLNRDYVKADAPETRAWLKLWNVWNPDFFVDCHVTDGADYRYNLTYQFEHHQTVADSIKNWVETAFDKRIIPNTEKAGNVLAPYLEFRDGRDLSKGFDEFLSTPRYATCYPILRNRPAVLIETHMLKPYKNRVLATYDFLRFTIEDLNQHNADLFDAIKRADAETSTAFQTYDAKREFPLQLATTEKSTPFAFKGVSYKIEPSDVSGDSRIIYDDSKPLDLTVPYYNDVKIAKSVAPPIAYIVPQQWKDVIELLQLHGLTVERTNRAQTFDVETYRLTEPKWARFSFESRVMLTDFKREKVTLKKEFPANSVIVKLNQPNAKVAINLLEPDAPDSLIKWGFFNAIFEQKEYGEGYVLEKLAREMLAKDENLKREFEAKLKNDVEFAKNPRARLNFFYDRSPYRDAEIGLYPIGRILR